MVLETNREMFVMPDPGEAQSEAFSRSINRGSKEEPNDPPGTLDTDREEKIGPRPFDGRYHVIEPLSDERDAVYESIAYPPESYVPPRSTRKGKACAGEQIVYTGSTPLTSPRGTFVVNGIDRVTTNQISRSPGTHHNLERGPNGYPVYTGTTIPSRGGKSKSEPDGKNRIWVRVRKKRKTSIQLPSLAMGSSTKDILDNACYPDTSRETRENNVWSGEHAVPESRRLSYGSTDEYPELLPDIFEESRQKSPQPRSETGEIGRANSNKKPDPDVPKNEIFPLPKDVSAATDHSIGIGIGIGTLDDTDHPKNRRIRTAADSSQDQSRSASERPADPMRGGMISRARRKNVSTMRGVANSSPSSTLKEFSGSHPPPQSPDQTNPSTQMVHKRKPSSPGPGGPTRRTASSQVRDIHPSHYGRARPIGTSEGTNAGPIPSSALHAGVNHWGYSTSPSHRISGVLSSGGEIAAYVSEDEGSRITTGTCSSVYRKDRGEQAIAARYRQESVTPARDQIHSRSIPPSQNPPAGAPLIPSPESNDANRTPTGSNTQRQAAPLLGSEQRIVGTGVEGQIASDPRDTIIAAQGGKTDYTDGERTTSVNGEDTRDTESVMYRSPNNSTRVHQKRPNGRFGQGGFPRKGQIAADSGAAEGGESASGINISMAYTPREGHNSEDSVPTSERPAFGDTYTSIHTDKYEMEARVTPQGTAERITGEIPHSDDYFLRNSDESGLVSPGSRVETGDVSVGKPTPRNPEESPKAPESNSPQAVPGIDITARETSPRVPTGGRGRIIDVRWIYPDEDNNTSGHTRVVHAYAPQARETQVGDKAAGRHGNKGITPKIAPRQDMPHLQDGTSIDMILSPSGVPPRMNVGQISERVPGPAGYHPERHHRIIPSDERYEREAPRKPVFPETYEASEQTANPRSLELGNPGKSRSIDGRTGEVSEQPVTAGKAHMPKSVHQADGKTHARSSGPHPRVTQQPLKGKSKLGGQRVGEMEVRAPEGSGVSHIPQEMPTTKPDHVQARREVVGTIVAGEPVYGPETTTPESPRSPVREPRRLAPDPDLAVVEKDLIPNNRSREG
uniref:DNA-directed RNA polymerase n=1 Tax=Selaginella bisulcata TaxID=1715365 RepID=A0A482CGS9_9TRAC|nr:RNA polymerase beta subunit [Selaginella bisulcata]QBL75953.1 RNA polymerase beta subunit [Selaginella bisulcata]